MGLRWQLGEWGFMKLKIELDDNYANTKVGPDVVVKVFIHNQKLLCDWLDTWALWG